MCDLHVDWHEAAKAADDLLRMLRIDVSKALDPMDPDDFIKITAQLSRDLEAKRRELVAADVDEALAGLDVDWVGLDPASRDALVQATNLAITQAELRTLPTINATITTKAEATIKGAKQSVSSTFDLNIGISTDLIDETVVNSVARQDVYFRTEIGNRSQAFTQKGQKIIRDGLDQGLRSADITADLVKAGRAVHFERSAHYMRVVATQAMNSSRVFGALRSFDAAGFETYAFDAVLDERTTEICRMLDGSVFRVGAALQRFADIAANPDPEAVRDLKPWVRERIDPVTGKRELFVQDRQGHRTRLAVVESPGFGVADRVGVYSDKLAIPTMEQLGISYPPLHGLCRSTIIPE